MRTFILFTIYILTFMAFFFVISAMGLLWVDSYKTIISNGYWFTIYSILLGSLMAAFPTREYYLTHEAHFDLVFG